MTDDEDTPKTWQEYELLALACLRLSDHFLRPGNSSQWVAHVYAQQAQAYATLALVRK